MQNKINTKIIILAVLALGAILSIIYGISASSKSKYAEPQRGDVAAVQNQYAAGAALPALDTPPAKRRAKRTHFTSWGKNPFAPKDAGPTGASLTLSGIVTVGSHRKAMIGDAMVAKGDKYGEYTVLDVKANSVVLNDGSKEIELMLEK